MSGLIAFTRPATKSVPDDVTFQHLGFFNYSAPAPTGVYDSNGLKSGEPIFPKATCSVNFSFQYTLSESAQGYHRRFLSAFGA